MKFSLGPITVKEEAALALSVSGQEFTFFVGKHVEGDWGEADAEMNEKGLREGTLVLSKFRTLRGHEIHVITFLNPNRNETCVFVPPSSGIRHESIPDLACWYPGGIRPGDEAMKPQGGNGSGKFNIHTDDMGGWVRVYTDPTAHVPDDFGMFLLSALADWLRQRPQLAMRCVVPINRNGNTVELHAWFECHVFPPTAIAPSAVRPH